MKFSLLTYSIILIAYALPSLGQSSWTETTKEEITEAYKAINEFYFTGQEYHVEFKYFSYKGHNSKTVHDQSSGYLMRKGKLVCTESMGRKTIQDEKIKVMVDKNAKRIGVYHPEETYYSQISSQFSENSLVFAEKFFKKTVGTNTHYKIQFASPSKVEQVELVMDKDNFLVAITSYFSQKMEWEDENGAKKTDKAKLKIEYNLVAQGHLNESIDKTSTYVQIKGDKVTLASKYESYQLNDFRIK